MDQSTPPPSPQPSDSDSRSSLAGSQPSRQPPLPQVVHVVAKSGGFKRAFMFIIGLLLMGGLFAGGIILGVVAMSYQPGTLIEHPYRDGGWTAERIAIIPVNGMIDARQAEFVRESVKHVLESHQPFAAVVLRVDSPGGGVTASDQIWNEIERLKDANIPVVASYGGTAASGGYYISCGADSIVAEPTTVTGSIGVIAQVFTFEELMGKVGVQPITLVATSSPDKDIANDLFHNWSDRDRQKIISLLDSAYATFNKRVRTGRKKALPDADQLSEVADGSIFTAKQALGNGLVDSIGYLDDAIVQAETRAGIAPGSAAVALIRRPPSIFALNQGLLSAPELTSAKINRLDADSIRSLMNDLGSPRLMYLMR